MPDMSNHRRKQTVGQKGVAPPSAAELKAGNAICRWKPMGTVWITLCDLHQLRIERVGVTSCHLHMWTGFLVSVIAHLM